MSIYKMIVASYCQDFLKSDMQHIYRQITNIENFRPHIITQKRQNAELFPFSEKQIHLLPKSKTRFFRRTLYRKILKKPWHIYIGEVKKLLYILQHCKADLLHIYFGHIAIHLLPLIKALEIPVIVSYHGADASNTEYPQAMQEVFSNADLILARSESLLKMLKEKNCPTQKLRLNRTSLDWQSWQCPERIIPNAENNKDSDWQFLQTCRLTEKKGIFTSLLAFKEILKTFPKSTLNIVGEGELRQKIESKITELNLNNKVKLHGFLPEPEIKKIVAQCHIYLQPSETDHNQSVEGVPNATLEAMASGLPVIATEHGGIPEAIKHEKSGFLVKEKNWLGIAKYACQLLQNPQLCKTISQNAVKQVANNFDTKTQIANLEKIYHEALKINST